MEAGLAELPCIEMDVDDREVAEISLIENLQRKDLTAFEEADGLVALAKRFGYKHEDIARKLGKARTSVTETISIANIPPDVRDMCRRADIASLLRHFANKTARKLGRQVTAVAPEFIERATAYDWPGNVRELQNVVERTLILSGTGHLDGSDLLPTAAASPSLATSPSNPVASDSSLEDVERAHIRRVLERTRWVIEGGAGAARILGLNPSTLRGRMRKLGINKTS